MDLESYISNAKLDIGRNLFIIRKTLMISHIELVEKTGITRPILSSIENYSANPTFETLLKLSSFLNISNDMLMMSKIKFERFQFLLKSIFEREKKEQFEFLIPPQEWKLLIKLSGNENKKNCNNVAKICAEIFKQNNADYGDAHNSMLLGATLGVLFQEDGFKFGLEFGSWLGMKLKS